MESDEMKYLAISLGESNVSNLQLCIENYSFSNPGMISVMFPSLLSMGTLETLSLQLQHSPVRLSLHDEQLHVVKAELEGLQKMLETSETLKHLGLYIDGPITEAVVQYLADGLSVNRPLTSLALSSSDSLCKLSPIFKALQHKKNLERLYVRRVEVFVDSTDPKAESGHSDLWEVLKSNACFQEVSLIGAGSNEIKYAADGLIDHPSLESIEIVGDRKSKLQTPTASRLLRVLYSCPALHSIKICGMMMTTCGSQMQDETGSESEIGMLIALLLQKRSLVLDLFSNLNRCLFFVDPYFKDTTWLPNSRLIVESLCKNLVPHYSFLKNHGFAKLEFRGHFHRIFALFEFEPVQHGETGDWDSTLLSMEWRSVDRIASFETIKAYQEERRLEEEINSDGEHKKWTALIGIRISMENKRMDLLLRIVQGVCWTKHIESLEIFMPIRMV